MNQLKTIFLTIIITAGVIGGGVWLYREIKNPSGKIDLSQESSVAIEVPAATPEKPALKAQISYLEGVAEKFTGNAWVAVQNAEVIESGGKIRTLAGARVVLTSEDGSVVRLDENSEIFLESTPNLVRWNLTEGNIFSRVAKNDTRIYEVKSAEYTLTALGTAFNVSRKGSSPSQLMVLESQVGVKDLAGKFIGTVSEKKKTTLCATLQEESLAAADLSEKFIDWSLKEEKLSVALENLNPSPDPSASITLTGQKTDQGVKLSWKVTGNLNAPGGFKIVKSLTKNPSYPADPMIYISNQAARSYEWGITSEKTYHFRICAYDGKSQCLSYSNDVAVVTPESNSSIEDEEDYADKISLTVTKKDSNTAKLSWTISGGKAPKGFKVVLAKDKNPEYPDDQWEYLTDPDTESYSWDYEFKKDTTYHFRVCIYEGGKCGTYSNDESVEF